MGFYLHNQTTTTGASLGAVSAGAEGCFAAFGVFLLHVILWFDGHVYHVRRIVIEPGICIAHIDISLMEKTPFPNIQC